MNAYLENVKLTLWRPELPSVFPLPRDRDRKEYTNSAETLYSRYRFARTTGTREQSRQRERTMTINEHEPTNEGARARFLCFYESNANDRTK